ncbi:unnamed protein product [Anisakis simplex]|uniref:BPTI/Kunitz inhibitor domain-containing protein n=1 Tax=Anisakis simplex TaxID=6269 RepID=A0A3P6PIX3_ANISI|nr:unnamed protein product [Anisakis simplex]
MMNVCEHPIEIGECSGVFMRFAYDKVNNECRQFTYGGCGGNGNNFATLADCRAKCVKVSCPPEPQCDLSRCQLVNDAQGCSFCSCPPDSTQPQQPSQGCPPIDVLMCAEPCIIFTNRRGCQECVCPVLPPNAGGPVPPSTDQLPANNQENIAPPSPPQSPSPPSPPAPAQEEHSGIPNVAEITERCTQKVDSGPCKNSVKRFYFNVNTGTCDQFEYGGCAGNRNHFFTLKECELHCARFASTFVS